MTFIDVKHDTGFEATSNVPALVGVQSTDTLIAVAANHSGIAPTPPAGWTKVWDPESNPVRPVIFTAPGSANAATTWTWASSQWRSVIISAWRDITPPTTAAFATDTQTITQLNAPSVTTANPNATLVVFGYASVGTTRTLPASMTPILTINTTGGSALARETIPTAGATGTRLFTTDQAAAVGVASFVLEPAGAPGDTTAPSVPGNVAASADSSSQVTVSWSASTDNVGIASYRLRRDGADVAGATALTGTSYADTGRSPSTTYSYTVSAVDAAGNRSAESAPASATTPAAPPADGSKIENFTDDFVTLDATKWTANGSPEPPANGVLNLPCTASYSTLTSLNAYDLTGSSCTIEFVGPPAIGAGTTSTDWALNLDASNRLRFYWEAGTLYAMRTVAGANTIAGSVAHDGTAHRWLRFSQPAGNVLWETSPDRVTWTTLGTWAPSFATTALKVDFLCGYYGAETAPGDARYDKLNVVGGDVTAPTISLADPTPAGQTAGFEHVEGFVTLTPTVSDDGGVDRVEFYVDNYRVATATDAPWTYEWDTLTRAAGTHTLLARAYDAAGNSADSAPVTVRINNSGRWTAPSSPAAAVLKRPAAYRWDYQTGDLSQWLTNYGKAPVLVRDKPHRAMRYAARYTIAYGENHTPGFDEGQAIAVDRTEMTDHTLAHSGNIAPGVEQWWAFSVMFPPNLVAPTSWCLFQDYHHTGSTGQTPLWFAIQPNVNPARMMMRVRGGAHWDTATVTDYDLGVAPLDGTWVDFRFYILWSDTAAGRIIVKKNTAPDGSGWAVVHDVSRANMYTDWGMYPNQGVYRNTVDRTEVWHHTGLRWGATEESVTY